MLLLGMNVTNKRKPFVKVNRPVVFDETCQKAFDDENRRHADVAKDLKSKLDKHMITETRTINAIRKETARLGKEIEDEDKNHAGKMKKLIAYVKKHGAHVNARK